MAEATFVLASIKQGGDIQSVAFVNGEFYSGTGKFDNGAKSSVLTFILIIRFFLLNVILCRKTYL